jgi:DNA-binding transcriptional ArsR family regulator
MENFTPAPCIPDDGIDARIPGSPFAVLTLVEVINRLNANPDAPDPTPQVLSANMNLSLPQVYAALAYYHANQALFDAELVRRREETEKALAELSAKHKGRNGFAEIYGKWPGDETDEEIEAALEELS